MTTMAELVIDDDATAWARLGFTVDAEATTTIGTVRLRLLAPSGGPGGIQAWVLAGAPEELAADVDGLATSAGDPPAGAGGDAHPIGASRIDHVVVTTPDLDRTVAAMTTSLALPLRRTREGRAGGRPVRQAFFRMGEVILEVVGGAEPEVPADDDAEPVNRDARPTGGPARFFGLVVVVDDLDAVAARLGPELLGGPRAAVQEGRRIATVRAAAGLQTALALMTP